MFSMEHVMVPKCEPADLPQLARLLISNGWPPDADLEAAVAWLQQEDIRYASDFAGAGVLSELACAPDLGKPAFAVMQSIVDAASEIKVLNQCVFLVLVHGSASQFSGSAMVNRALSQAPGRGGAFASCQAAKLHSHWQVHASQSY